MTFDPNDPESNLEKFVEQYASTMAFLTLVACQLPYAFALRNDHKTSFKIWFFSNIYLIWAVALSIVIQILLIVVDPLRDAFDLQKIACTDLGIVILLWILPFAIIELKKVIFKKSKIF